MLKDRLKEHLSKGIAVETLRGLVKNTAPFVFGENPEPRRRYVGILSEEKTDLSALEYFELCIAAHFATVGTFVPTDVDLAIREKLWKKVSTPEEMAAMWSLVEEFKTWDESLVSRRWVTTESGKKLSGHQGEWLSIAMGAYGAAVKRVHAFVPEIRSQVEAMVKEHEEALQELRLKFLSDPIPLHAKNYLDGAAAVAHNLGDLNRMIDTCELGEMDVLRRRVQQPREEFEIAGKIYREMLASENHRHFPLREPRGLRKSSQFLLNFGPFLDEWGTRIVESGKGKDPILNDGDLRDVAEALILGWKRLNPKGIYATQGYARALAGMAAAFPKGRSDLENLVSPGLKKQMNESGLPTLLNVSRAQYEKQWAQKLFRALSENAE